MLTRDDDRHHSQPLDVRAMTEASAWCGNFDRRRNAHDGK